MNLNVAREEITQHLRDLHSQFLSAIEGLSEDQMTEPSIAGWSVKDHLTHLAFWHELRASEILRISAGYDHAWPLSVDSEALNNIVQPARSHLTLAQALWEYESSVQKAIDAVAKANERGLTQSNFGEVGPRPAHDLGHTEFIRNWRKRLGI